MGLEFRVGVVEFRVRVRVRVRVECNYSNRGVYKYFPVLGLLLRLEVSTVMTVDQL